MKRKELNISAREADERIAQMNRTQLAENRVFTVNIIGSPGCGKTSILEYTANHFAHPFAVLVGDVKTALDADRLLKTGNQNAHAIETGGGCHLSAAMIREKLRDIDLKNIDHLFIENVGNLVCPSSFDLGENLKIAVLSVPEGDEKVRKYPALFLRAQAVIINKIDLLGVLDYDIRRVKEDCRAHNPQVRIFETSTKTGEGLEQWFDFLREKANQKETTL